MPRCESDIGTELCSHWPDSDSSFSSKVQVHLQEASNLGFEVHKHPPNYFLQSSSGSWGVSRKDPALQRHFCHRSASSSPLQLLLHPPCGDQL